MNTVLIIDDDPDYRKFMGDFLEQRGWQVLEAENGDAGIELVKPHRPDVVLSDLLMASGNGFQVCRAIAEQRRCGTPKSSSLRPPFREGPPGGLQGRRGRIRHQAD